METKEIHNIVIIGAGNVASHLANAFYKKNKNILQIISRTRDSAEALAGRLNCLYSTEIKNAVPDADLYLVAVADDVMPQIAKQFPHKNSLIVHTSGAVSMDALKNASANYGVFYPLQTFSKNLELDYRQIPFFVEAKNQEDKDALFRLGKHLSDLVFEIGLKQRQALHVAAVYACNFTNHLYNIAANICEKSDISFDVLCPLIIETARKATLLHPKHAQTGPAARKDNSTIAKHLELLDVFEDYQKIYNFMTRSIQKEIEK